MFLLLYVAVRIRQVASVRYFEHVAGPTRHCHWLAKIQARNTDFDLCSVIVSVTLCTCDRDVDM